jgi:opacity protein-like surface antigen
MPLTTSNGTASTSAIMGNLVYDIPLHPFGLPIQPYIGAGIGYAKLGINATGGAPLVIQRPGFVAAPGSYFTTPGTVNFGSAGAFAYQAIAGFSVPLPLVPGLDLTLEYRFFGTAKEDIPVTKVATFPAAQAFIPSPSNIQGFPLRDNEVLLGLRYTFATPPM